MKRKKGWRVGNAGITWWKMNGTAGIIILVLCMALMIACGEAAKYKRAVYILANNPCTYSCNFDDIATWQTSIPNMQTGKQPRYKLYNAGKHMEINEAEASIPK
jgi:hypothetical protein